LALAHAAGVNSLIWVILATGGPGEHLAGNGADAVLAQPREAAQIKRKAINRLARNGWTPVCFQGRRD